MLEISNPPPDVRAMVVLHDLTRDILHTNLVAEQCVCKQRVVARPTKSYSDSGVACHACGGITVRTGTCYTCTTCGETGGCG